MHPCGAGLGFGPEKPVAFPAGRAPRWAMRAAGLLVQDQPATQRVLGAPGGWREVRDGGCMAPLGQAPLTAGLPEQAGGTRGGAAC